MFIRYRIWCLKPEKASRCESKAGIVFRMPENEYQLDP
jgi:hypothetical protein